MKVSQSFLITNKLGLHARAATQLAQLAGQFNACTTLYQQDKSAPADSVLGLLLLESCQGKQVNVVCEGKDAQQALDAIGALITEKFHEEE